jgi:hypothetical protein
VEWKEVLVGGPCKLLGVRVVAGVEEKERRRMIQRRETTQKREMKEKRRKRENPWMTLMREGRRT